MDPRTVELLNLELDNRLDAAGRAELAACAKNDPTVAVQREQLQQVSRLLELDPVPELSPDFADGVMQKTGLARNLNKQTGRRRQRYWQAGLALAASTGFAVLALQFLGPDAAETEQYLSGTMAPAGPSVSTQVTESGQLLRFTLAPGAAGEIDIRFTNGARIVVPLAAKQHRVDVAVQAGEFAASLRREGLVTPITIRSR